MAVGAADRVHQAGAQRRERARKLNVGKSRSSTFCSFPCATAVRRVPLGGSKSLGDGRMQSRVFLLFCCHGCRARDPDSGMPEDGSCGLSSGLRSVGHFFLRHFELK
ncbi:hypothetical protein NDU88_001541 [Pleurodeles waltl]|uniref:Uncharacterized protein n=1 Tax=Pleurodeles waltl TaxID=8319 RepID=A0AAV7T0A6_PLEWA|nr:hypothetical protein NDU88_001541 [Pleurodeles waltl]